MQATRGGQLCPRTPRLQAPGQRGDRIVLWLCKREVASTSAHSLMLLEGVKGKSLQLNSDVEEGGSWGRMECCSTARRPP